MANIELDGANRTIKVDSSNLTLDIPGDIILDADGANVTFKDGGTSVLDISNSSTDAVLTVSTQDKDLIIKGDDGGSAITAATFDMSDAGTLILNHDLVVADAGKVGSASATDAMTISSGGIVTFKDDILIKDGGTIGSASDADSITIASNGAVTFSQTPVFPDGSIAVADLDIDGATDIGAAIVDADLFIIDDGAGGTNRKVTASRIKTYAGFTATTITGETALAAQPAADDEIIISDAGTLKRLDIKHIQNTPAFHVNGGANGNVANSTEVVIENDNEVFDSDGCYDTSTYRFTPAVAGKYYIYGSARWQTSTNAATRLNIAIVKNGSEVLGARNNNTDYSTVNISGIVVLDDDDYVDLRSYQNTGNTTALSTEANLTFFGGFRIAGL